MFNRTGDAPGIPPLWVRGTMIIQQLISTIGLFLIGLALRNRFKMS